MKFSHTHKVGNNGINANFVFLRNYSFHHYLDHKVLVNVKSAVSWQKGFYFISLLNFEWHNQNEVGNIGIPVLWKHLFHQLITSMISIHCFHRTKFFTFDEKEMILFLCFEKLFFIYIVKVRLDFSIQATNKHFLINTHYNIMYWPVTCLWSSNRLFKEFLLAQPWVELNTLPGCD